MTGHYTLPDGNVQIGLSGGRSSAYMLHQILEANGDLPDRVVVSFQNTGREFNQTLDFVREVGLRWGVDIVWLEYLPDAPFFTETGWQGASRDGQPFEALIEKRKYLPNQQSRFCTVELKLRTVKRYLVANGWERWTNAVGIRKDEDHRAQKPTKDRWVNWRPMVDAGVSKHDVALFWRGQPFDLGLENINGKTPRGNCDGCFLKSEANLGGLTRDFPDRAKWWEDMEAKVAGLTTGDGGTFSKRYARAELRDFIERQGDWALSTEGALCQADGGECHAF